MNIDAHMYNCYEFPFYCCACHIQFSGRLQPTQSTKGIKSIKYVPITVRIRAPAFPGTYYCDFVPGTGSAHTSLSLQVQHQSIYTEYVIYS